MNEGWFITRGIQQREKEQAKGNEKGAAEVKPYSDAPQRNDPEPAENSSPAPTMGGGKKKKKKRKRSKKKKSRSGSKKKKKSKRKKKRSRRKH